MSNYTGSMSSDIRAGLGNALPISHCHWSKLLIRRPGLLPCCRQWHCNQWIIRNLCVMCLYLMSPGVAWCQGHTRPPSISHQIRYLCPGCYQVTSEVQLRPGPLISTLILKYCCYWMLLWPMLHTLCHVELFMTWIPSIVFAPSVFAQVASFQHQTLAHSCQ